MNLETVSASEDETSVVTEQEETQDTEAFTSETDAQQTETEQTSEQFTSETETETSAETEEQIPDRSGEAGERNTGSNFKWSGTDHKIGGICR